MKQAMFIACVMELAGSVSVGLRVADIIRTRIIDPHLYSSDPAVLMLAMIYAIIAYQPF